MIEPSIVLIPIGYIDESLLESLQRELGLIFHLRIKVSNPLPVPERAYNPRRQQYHSSAFLKELEKRCFAGKRSKCLGITSLDLFTNNLNFIFGQAIIDGDVCVISTHRLRPEFYGQPPNSKIFVDRTVKEAVHELGHSFGLMHCPNSLCVMHFSNHILDTDRKSKNFCERCESYILEKLIISKKQQLDKLAKK